MGQWHKNLITASIATISKRVWLIFQKKNGYDVEFWESYEIYSWFPPKLKSLCKIAVISTVLKLVEDANADKSCFRVDGN